MAGLHVFVVVLLGNSLDNKIRSFFSGSILRIISVCIVIVILIVVVEGFFFFFLLPDLMGIQVNCFAFPFSYTILFVFQEWSPVRIGFLDQK